MNAFNKEAATPLRRFAFHSTTTCSAAASAYGKCILATYTDVHKDTCKEEFQKFGACMREAVSTAHPIPLTDVQNLTLPSLQMKRKW